MYSWAILRAKEDIFIKTRTPCSWAILRAKENESIITSSNTSMSMDCDKSREGWPRP